MGHKPALSGRKELSERPQEMAGSGILDGLEPKGTRLRQEEKDTEKTFEGSEVKALLNSTVRTSPALLGVRSARQVGITTQTQILLLREIFLKASPLTGETQRSGLELEEGRHEFRKS